MKNFLFLLPLLPLTLFFQDPGIATETFSEEGQHHEVIDSLGDERYYLQQYLEDLKKVNRLLETNPNIWESASPEEHPDSILNASTNKETEDNLALGVYNKENADLIVEISDLEKEVLHKTSKFMTEAELERYTESFKAILNNLFKVTKEKPELASICYDNSLFLKGFILNTARQFGRLAKNDPETAELYKLLKSYSKQLGTELVKSSPNQNKIDDLTLTSKNLEKQIAKKVASFEKDAQLKWQDIQKKLKPNEAAIEFIYYTASLEEILSEEWMESVVSIKSEGRNTNGNVYAALLIRPDLDRPKYIHLCTEIRLDSLLDFKEDSRSAGINTVYGGTRGLDDEVSISVHEQLYDALWKPLDKDLKGINRVYYSSSGLLHRVNINAIPVDEESVLADHFKLINMSSTGQLINTSPLQGANTDAFLFGGIKYEVEEPSDLQPATNQPETDAAMASRGEPTFSSSDRSLRGGSWKYLPFTLKEVNTINEVLSQTGNSSKVVDNLAATEEFFKQLGRDRPSPRILHIATHGFFFPDPEIERKERERIPEEKSFLQNKIEFTLEDLNPGLLDSIQDNAADYQAGAANEGESMDPSEEEQPVFKKSNHPMIRSGLILAGGNHAWETGKPLRPGLEDGILTAFEISQMNLSGTELVVLSACETGLGDIKGDEGVYGFQRAFKIAGVRYLIMTLWQVPDRETQQFMTTFYKKWLGDGMTIQNAFQSTQLEMRDRFIDPFKWAAFVLIE